MCATKHVPGVQSAIAILSCTNLLYHDDRYQYITPWTWEFMPSLLSAEEAGPQLSLLKLEVNARCKSSIPPEQQQLVLEAFLAAHVIDWNVIDWNGCTSWCFWQTSCCCRSHMLHLLKLVCHSMSGINQKIQIWYRLVSLWVSCSIVRNCLWGGTSSSKEVPLALVLLPKEPSGCGQSVMATPSAGWTTTLSMAEMQQFLQAQC